MPITSNIDSPRQARQISEPWVVRKLFSNVNAVGEVLKTFSPLEVYSAFMIFITGTGELFGRTFSIIWYAILLMTIGGSLWLRFVENKNGKRASKKK